MKSKGDIDAYLKALFKREAGGVDHTVVNRAGYIGKYQFGEPALIDLGYYVADKTKENDWAGKWKGKNGINSLDDFLQNSKVQDLAAKEWVALLCQRMRTYKLGAYIGKKVNGIEITDSGIIAGAHLKGFGSAKSPGVIQFLKSDGKTDPKDGLGTPVSHYVELFAGYDVGCCKKACLAFAEKITNAPIAQMKVQIRKNGKVYKAVKTDKNGSINTPNLFSPGDSIEIWVEKISGGFKSLKSTIIGDVNLVLAFFSPKTKAVAKTEKHEGTPQPRAEAASNPKPTINSPKSDNHQPQPAEISGASSNTVDQGSSAKEVTKDGSSAEFGGQSSLQASSEIFDHLDSLDKIWGQMCAYQSQDAQIDDAKADEESSVSVQNEDHDESVAEVSKNNAIKKQSGSGIEINVVPSKVEMVRNTKGHPQANVKKNPPPPVQAISAPMKKTISGLLFPLTKKPNESYKTGARRFGSNRSNGQRKHAGIDLYSPVGTSVRAMADGEIIQAYEFYGKTWAIEVNHGSFIARYGEISEDSILVENGDTIKRGQKIGEIGKLKGLDISMLHLEMYGTTEDPTEKGKNLTQRGNAPFQRRSDLIDPTDSIDKAVFE